MKKLLLTLALVTLSACSYDASARPTRTPFVSTSQVVCPSGMFRTAQSTKLYVSDDSSDGSIYHTIPEGDPVGATGRCSGNYAQVKHMEDTGWVFKHHLD